MGSQRIIFAVLSVLIAIGTFFYFRPKSDLELLRVCTWSNYFPEDVLKLFTDATGIRVELSYVSSNEELFAKFKAGATGFDVIQPSDYMVRQMSRLDMLAPLRHDKLTHLSALETYYTELSYDPGLKYSVPFTWGTSGIAVNTERVKVPEEGVSFSLLFASPDFKHVSLLDDMREAFAAALLWRGHSLNSNNSAAWMQAKADLAKTKSKILMFTSEPKPLLLNGEVTIAHIFSTDGIQAQRENPKIQYFIPKEGASLWTDNFAIPKSSKKQDQAHRFIDFFLDPDNALRTAMQNHLATVNRETKRKLPPEVLGNPNYYPPPSILKKLEVIEEVGDRLPQLNRMWTELKSS